MKKLTLALALGSAVAAGSAFPSAARAGGVSTVAVGAPTTTTPMIQTLSSADISSAQFNSLFAPISGDPAQKSSIDFYGAPARAP